MKGRLAFVLLLCVLVLHVRFSWSLKTPLGATHFLAAQQKVVIYVDGSTGHDAGNNGTSFSRPLRTVQRAQQVIREIKQANHGAPPPGGITVTIRKGFYGPSAFDSPTLSFTGADSGTAESPIVWTSYQGETVTLSGGVLLPASGWSAAPSVGPRVMKQNLANLGLRAYFGNFPPAGNKLGGCFAMMELFFGGNPMTIARYPNIAPNGTWLWMNITDVPNPTSFKYSGDRPSRWISERNLWLHGYWKYDWADSYVQVTGISPQASTINTSPNTPALYGFQVGGRWMAVNALSELDAPGEYYIDRDNAVLYFYPPGALASNDAVLTVTQSVLAFSNTSYVTFSNVHVLHAQGSGISATGVDHVVFDTCEISNHGGKGAVISGSWSGISRSAVSGTGCGGISLVGGDNRTLVSGNSFVRDSKITRYARTVRTYNPAIWFGGVGNVYSGNIMEDGPHAGMLGAEGNNLLMENNLFKDLTYECSDCGAFYIGRTWTAWGNVLRGNRFENIRQTEPNLYGDVQAVYFDDQISGWLVFNNTFINCQVGVLIGGGRMTTVNQNTFTKCDLGVSVDNRGVVWQQQYCGPGGLFAQQLATVDYTQPPWSVAYPWLPLIYLDHPCLPVYNVIVSNTYCQLGSQGFISINATQAASWFDLVDGNTESCL